MNIGTRKIVVDEAIAQLRLYAETNGAVLQYYDGRQTCVGGSDPDQYFETWPGCDLCRPAAMDIPWLLVERRKEFAAIPVDARLEGRDPGQRPGLGRCRTKPSATWLRPRQEVEAAAPKRSYHRQRCFIRMTYGTSAGSSSPVHRDLVNRPTSATSSYVGPSPSCHVGRAVARRGADARLLDILASLLGDKQRSLPGEAE
jgi:hypothetical protein